MPEDPQIIFAGTDIYLLDQIIRGRINPGMTIFDAGCGYGRNLNYFLRAGYEVYGVDSDPAAIAEVRDLAKRLAPRLPLDHFRTEPLEAMSWPPELADVVLSNAVLHFAGDDQQFRSMLEGSWRVLKPGGLFFCRLASTIGMEHAFKPIAGRRFRLPDGSKRYLVDADMLLELTSQLDGELLDPLKTTVVHGLRCMTTWVLRKR